MKSTLFNMVAVLFGITLVASAGVGVVNMITVEPIAQAELTAKADALKQVLPPFDGTSDQTLTIDEIPGHGLHRDAGRRGDGLCRGVDVEKRLRRRGTPDGRLRSRRRGNQRKRAQATETPGLGTKMADEGNVLLASIQGKNLEQMKLVDGKLAVRKDGGDVDALTAATISSRAYVDAINRAYMAYRSVARGVPATDVASGASAQTGGDAREGGENE